MSAGGGTVGGGVAPAAQALAAKKKPEPVAAPVAGQPVLPAGPTPISAHNGETASEGPRETPRLTPDNSSGTQDLPSGWRHRSSDRRKRPPTLPHRRQAGVEAVNDRRPASSAATASAAGPANRAPNQLAVIFPAKYNFGKTFCERRAARLEEKLAELVGGPVKLEFVLADAVRRHRTPPKARQPVRPASSRERMAQILKTSPLVRRAAELFDAHPVLRE